jgi:putative oxidoreductase
MSSVSNTSSLSSAVLSGSRSNFARSAVTAQTWGIALLRAVVGIVFLAHGSQKLFSYGFAGVAGFFAHAGIPVPAVSAVVVTLVEFLGGLALLLGIGTRVAALLLALDMLGAIVFVHGKAGFFLPTGFEYALTLLVANLGLLLAGPGAAALDNAISRRK